MRGNIIMIKAKLKKYRLHIFIGALICAVTIIFLLILFAGRKTYTVTFDLNGGELISGSLQQEVRRGGHATPPNVGRNGCYLLKWSGQYSKITGDSTVTAVWEYETTSGIEYEVPENGNYCLIDGCYSELTGDVYVGSYFNELQILGINANAFKNCGYITSLFFLDGIVNIGERAFANCTGLEQVTLSPTLKRIGKNVFENCTSLTEITIPENVTVIGEGAFEGCTSLQKVILPEGLLEIKASAFKGCVSLTEIVIPESVKIIGYSAFDNPELVITVISNEDTVPDTFNNHWALRSKEVLFERPDTEDSQEDKNENDPLGSLFD